MNRKQIIGAVVAAVLFTGVGVSSVIANTVSQNFLQKTAQQMTSMLEAGDADSLPAERYVGVVAVEGMIQPQPADSALLFDEGGYRHRNTLDYIDEMMQDSDNAGILLRVDSPAELCTRRKSCIGS